MTPKARNPGTKGVAQKVPVGPGAKSAAAARKPKRAPREIAAPAPRSVPIVAKDVQQEPERPFEEGAHDAVDPDLRHRMISGAAYALYARRGYLDGFDVEDWLTAEAEVDHILLDRSGGEKSP